MTALRQFHAQRSGRLTNINGAEVISDYGDLLGEHLALRETAGVLDLSFRSRVCLTGADRTRFLHGQVTNDVNRLRPGEGCYTALITAKGKLQSDLNIYCLQDELLLDFEPGLTSTIIERLEKYVIADDVQVVDVASLYGLLSVQGPKAAAVVDALKLGREPPAQPFALVKVADPTLGDIYVVNQPRLQTSGFDLFIPVASLPELAQRTVTAGSAVGGRACGWEALELARVEAGIPRFGADMDETNIPLEAGIESRAISFAKGCYIGQEVISRIRTYGQVAKALRGLVLAPDLKALPVKGDKLLHGGKEVGYVTSAVNSPTFKTNLALGYVRREVNQIGTVLALRTREEESPARIVELPFAYHHH